MSPCARDSKVAAKQVNESVRALWARGGPAAKRAAHFVSLSASAVFFLGQALDMTHFVRLLLYPGHSCRFSPLASLDGQFSMFFNTDVGFNFGFADLVGPVGLAVVVL